MGGSCPTVATQIDPRTKVRLWYYAAANYTATVTAVTRKNSATLTLSVTGDFAYDTTTEATEATAYPYVKGGTFMGVQSVTLDGRAFQSFHGDGSSGLNYVVLPLDA